MIHASHLAKGLDSDVSCMPAVPEHAQRYLVPPSTTGAGISRRYGATAWAEAPLFAHACMQFSEFLGSGQNAT